MDKELFIFLGNILVENNINKSGILLSYMITFFYKVDSLRMGVILYYNVEFYKRINGEIPVQEILINLPSKVRAKAILEIELLKKPLKHQLEK